MLRTHGSILILLECIEADAKSALICERATDFTLHLVRLCGANDAGVVDEAVLGRVFLRLKGAEEGFLGT